MAHLKRTIVINFLYTCLLFSRSQHFVVGGAVAKFTLWIRNENVSIAAVSMCQSVLIFWFNLSYVPKYHFYSEFNLTKLCFGCGRHWNCGENDTAWRQLVLLFFIIQIKQSEWITIANMNDDGFAEWFFFPLISHAERERQREMRRYFCLHLVCVVLQLRRWLNMLILTQTSVIEKSNGKNQKFDTRNLIWMKWMLHLQRTKQHQQQRQRQTIIIK